MGFGTNTCVNGVKVSWHGLANNPLPMPQDPSLILACVSSDSISSVGYPCHREIIIHDIQMQYHFSIVVILK